MYHDKDKVVQIRRYRTGTGTVRKSSEMSNKQVQHLINNGKRTLILGSVSDLDPA